MTEPSERASNFRRLFGDDCPNRGRSGLYSSPCPCPPPAPFAVFPSECIDSEFEEEEAVEGVGEGCDSAELLDMVDAMEDRVVEAVC